MNDPLRTDYPHDRLTRLTNVGMEAIRNDPDYHDDHVIVCIDTETDGALGMLGYDEGDEVTPLSDLLQHTQALARTTGREMHVIFPEAS